jgi:hypothetical protein
MALVRTQGLILFGKQFIWKQQSPYFHDRKNKNGDDFEHFGNIRNYIEGVQLFINFLLV